MKRFLLLLALLLAPLAARAAVTVTNIAMFPSLSVAYTNYVDEAIFTNGVTIGGVRNTNWPSGSGAPVGTMVNSGTPSIGAIPISSTATGTNYTPSSVTITNGIVTPDAVRFRSNLASTNGNVPAIIYQGGQLINGVADDTLYMGLNSNTNNSRVDTSKSRWMLALEADYKPYATGDVRYAEMNLDYLSADALTSLRPFSIGLRHDTLETAMALGIEDFQVQSTLYNRLFFSSIYSGGALAFKIHGGTNQTTDIFRVENTSSTALMTVGSTGLVTAAGLSISGAAATGPATITGDTTISGKLSVGTLTPSNKLDVVTALNSDGIRITAPVTPMLQIWANASTTNSRNWSLADNYNAVGLLELMRSADSTSAPTSATLQSWSTNGSAVTGTFTASGQVGIGTTAMSNKLHVVTADADGIRITASGAPALLFYTTTGTSTARRYQVIPNYNFPGELEIMASTSNSGAPATTVARFGPTGAFTAAGAVTGTSYTVGALPGITTTWTNMIPGVITQRISAVGGIIVTNLTL